MLRWNMSRDFNAVSCCFSRTLKRRHFIKICLVFLPWARKILQGKLLKKKKNCLKYLSEFFTALVWWSVCEVRETAPKFQANVYFSQKINTNLINIGNSNIQSKKYRWNTKQVDSSWNVTARGDARGGMKGGNWRMEWVASTLHTTSEHGVSSITTADAHTSAASSRQNWRPRRFKWTRPFRRKTKSGFCACGITFQT